MTIDHKGHFRKNLTWIFKFSSFSWYHGYISEQNEFDDLMQDLMLNRLASIPNPPSKKKKKLACPILVALFHFETSGFSSFPDHFAQLRNFFQVSLNQNNWLVQTIFFLLINPVPRVPSFFIRTKIRLKNRLTAVHLLQCKTNFLHLCF